MCAIYLKQGSELVAMVEQPYDAESVLQQLLADYPGLLAGEEDERDGRDWLLVQREMGVAGEENGGNRWSLDHLFIDQDGVPTLVEVKRSSDTRIRREVVGQMLDYAANASAFWGLATIRAAFEQRHPSTGVAASALDSFLGPDADHERFWSTVGEHLEAGRLRLVFVADEIPTELRRVVEFLNEQMQRTEVLALEVRQYVERGGDRLTLVPRLIGATQAARIVKGGNGRPPRRKLTDLQIREGIAASLHPDVARRLVGLYDFMAAEGRSSFGTASVTMWLGEDTDPAKDNPISLSIYRDGGLILNWRSIVDRRTKAELDRLADLLRAFPELRDSVDAAQQSGYRALTSLPPAVVLDSDEHWRDIERLLADATQHPDEAAA